jgi:hypothetical protein
MCACSVVKISETAALGSYLNEEIYGVRFGEHELAAERCYSSILAGKM